MPFNFFNPFGEQDEAEVCREVESLSRIVKDNVEANGNNMLESRICSRMGLDTHVTIVDKINPSVGDFLFNDYAIYNSDIYQMIVEVTSYAIYTVNFNGKLRSYEPSDMARDCYAVYRPSETILSRFFEKVKDSIQWDDDEGNLCDVLKVAKERWPSYFRTLNAGTCSICGNPALPKVTVDGVDICRSCYDTLYTSCSHCGKTVKRENAYPDRNGYTLCAECNKRHWVLPYHGYYPKVKFYGDNKDNSVPYMGFELEVDCGGEDRHKVEKIMPLLNKEETGEIFAYCSHDSSIDNGFEIITQPATMQYHASISDVYNRAIQKLKAMGYASHETTTCGFHVHFNRDFFGCDYNESNDCIRRLIFMSEKFWDELCVFARRPERRLSHYAKKVPNGMEITEYMGKANRSGLHEYHYYAVNIANENTIEFRMFRGTLNLNTIMATLQLVNNMAITAKNKTMEEIKAMRFEDLLTTAGQHKYWARHRAVADFEE